MAIQNKYEKNVNFITLQPNDRKYSSVTSEYSIDVTEFRINLMKISSKI